VAVVESLRGRRVDIESAIFVRLYKDLRGQLKDDAAYLVGMKSAISAAVEYGLEGIGQRTEGPPRIPDEVVRQARRAAHLGVRLDTVLRRYVAGYTVLEDSVMEEADRGEFADNWSACRSVLKEHGSLLDRLMAAVTEEYENEMERARRSPSQRRAAEVQRLLAGADAFDAIDLAYDFRGWHLGAIAVGPESQQVVRTLATRLDRRLLSVPFGRDIVWAWLGGSTSVVPDAGQGLGLAGHGATLALGEPAKGLDGWRLTHRQAQAALAIALRASARDGLLTRYADVALLASALQDEVLATSLVELFLSPLDSQRDGGAISRETLRAYFATARNASSAAAALGVARQTVENRLRVVEQALARPLHTCAVELELALRIDEARGR